MVLGRSITCLPLYLTLAGCVVSYGPPPEGSLPSLNNNRPISIGFHFDTSQFMASSQRTRTIEFIRPLFALPHVVPHEVDVLHSVLKDSFGAEPLRRS